MLKRNWLLRGLEFQLEIYKCGSAQFLMTRLEHSQAMNKEKEAWIALNYDTKLRYAKACLEILWNQHISGYLQKDGQTYYFHNKYKAEVGKLYTNDC